MMSRMIFSKYSNNRKSKFQIVTSIYADKDGHKWVEKRAKHIKAQEHIDKMVRGYELLSQHNKNEGLKINTCVQDGKVARFEYVQGKLFSNILTEIINSGDYIAFIEKIKEYVQLTKQVSPLTNFEITKEFIEVFGEVKFNKTLEAGLFTNIDFTFDNIIINEYINVIDYEWIFEFPVPVNYVIYRAINVYRMKESLEEEINLVEICRLLGITKEEIEQYKSMELHFQEYVNEKQREVKQPIRLNEILNFKNEIQQKLSVQVFNDFGNGFTEENSYRIETEAIRESVYKLTIGIDKNIKTIRIDPLEDYCMMQIESAIFSNGIEVKIADYTTNAIEMGGNLIFLNVDPQLIFSVDEHGQMRTLEVIFKLENISVDLVRVIQDIHTKQQNVLREHLQLKQEDESVKIELQQSREQGQRLTQSLREKEDQLIELQKQIEEKNKMCIQLDEMVENANGQIAQVTNDLRQKENELLQLTSKLAETERRLVIIQEEVRSIKASRSWKMITRIKNTMLWKIIKKIRG